MAINGGDATWGVAVFVLEVNGHVRSVQRPQGGNPIAFGGAVGGGPARCRASCALSPVLQQQPDALHEACKHRQNLVS